MQNNMKSIKYFIIKQKNFLNYPKVNQFTFILKCSLKYAVHLICYILKIINMLHIKNNLVAYIGSYKIFISIKN